MSGVRRLIIGDITQGNLRGKALSDALNEALTKEDKDDSVIKKKIYGKPKKK